MGPHKLWAMSLIPCWRYQRGIVVSTHSTVSPGKVLKIDISVVGEFCGLEFEHTLLCEIITYTVMSFSVTIKYVWNSWAPQHSGPLDFVHPCPMVVTPLHVVTCQLQSAKTERAVLYMPGYHTPNERLDWCSQHSLAIVDGRLRSEVTCVDVESRSFFDSCNCAFSERTANIIAVQLFI